MPREFTSEKAVQDHAELTGYICVWEGTPMFATRQRLLSPDQYEIVDVRTSEGMKRAMLFPRATPKSELNADALLRDTRTMRQERWQALRSDRGKRRP